MDGHFMDGLVKGIGCIAVVVAVVAAAIGGLIVWLVMQ